MKPDRPILLEHRCCRLRRLSPSGEILHRQPAQKDPVIFMSALTGDVTKRTVAMHAEDSLPSARFAPAGKRINELLHIARRRIDRARIVLIRSVWRFAALRVETTRAPFGFNSPTRFA